MHGATIKVVVDIFLSFQPHIILCLRRSSGTNTWPLTLHVTTLFKERQLCKLSTFMLFNSKIIQLQGTNLCFLDRGWRSWSSTGLRNISTNIGWYFLNTTIDTVKLRSTLSILTRNSAGMFAMSAHFLLLLKNWIRLKHNSCYLYTVSRSKS